MKNLSEKERFIIDCLLKNNKLNENELNIAIEKRTDDILIYDTLLANGLINNYYLSEAKAAYYRLDFVDLNVQQPDSSYLIASERFNYLKYKYIPCRKDKDGRIVLATIDINPQITNWADERYGKDRYKFAITSPYDIHWVIQRAFAKEDDYASRETIEHNCPHYSAKAILGPKQLFVFLTFIAIVIGLIIIDKHAALVTFLILSNVIYFIFIVFKLALFLIGLARYPAYNMVKSKALQGPLPTYSILVPLYKEKRTLKHLVKALYELDYPKDKLDIKFVVEAQDYETIETLKILRCPANFEIIRVPYSLPQTKAKACNYALRFTKGEYITIFDAEDRPESSQLKEAIYSIKQGKKNNVIGVQAKLNYYNRSQNNLTALFAIEYAVWFEFLLRGLLRLGIPIPLGGTSNHLERRVLDELYAWDPYNVTEDADLGLRLAYSGYKVDLIHSTTWEEAPHTISSWIKQRTRWIKGYIQTYFVHMRSPLKALRKFGLLGFLGFQLFVGAPSLVYIISPVLWGISLIVLFTDLNSPYYYFTQFTLFNFFLGGVVHIMLGAVAIMRYGWWKLTPHCLLFPFYWVLHSLASFRAIWQLFAYPHYWDKTTHGHSVKDKD